ncbi:hypothetical protein J2T02_003198 [Chitinophaga terrae (ex Kim and Jung 2007)]|jgi:hypothetical protein|uniref:hypothetical protein n=1 Tax=Chitinophaga terrae (ex Kim and Jung 2007) TaxID=408074 RepID=UPI00278846BC|nr:hypothetical protein [Chitinophaga terrae (ex Kim and Jung 2007)]MDQ0108076.1 hypothetical protein [Chitinophaga terrae (ex Kim and Jung 2007)]
MEEKSEEWQSFNGTIDMLKKNAAADTHPLSDKDIMEFLDVDAATYEHYQATDQAPEEIFTQLYATYRKYLPAIVTTIRITSCHYPDDDDIFS